MTSAAEIPAEAAFQRESGEIRYVCMCSGDFSSSAKLAISDLASSKDRSCTSRSREPSLWTMSGRSGLVFGIVRAKQRTRNLRAIQGGREKYNGAMRDLVIVGSASENTFVEDIAHHLKQHEDYHDLISLKTFLNTEFCPRFIIDEQDTFKVGRKLEGKEVMIVSTSFSLLSRDELATRNFLIARAAKDNGADRVILLEPDLFYSAQDRGPRPEHGFSDVRRDERDLKKFDGQAFSARLYADLLTASGVDEVVTVDVHSESVRRIFLDRFSGRFHDLRPAELYADYLNDSDIVRLDRLLLCSPDQGANDCVTSVQSRIRGGEVPVLFLEKKRDSERQVALKIADESGFSTDLIRGREVVIIDDMVRTGNTIVETCKLIKRYEPHRILFLVTHFCSSREVRNNLNNPIIDEIVTTSSIPTILNRDMQGRLRHKMVVLRVSRWIAAYIQHLHDPDEERLSKPLYKEDMSSKNPRWRGTMGPLFA